MSSTWVLPNSTKTTPFFHTFTTLGAHTVRLDVVPLSAGDTNPANNTFTSNIDVHEPLPDFRFSALTATPNPGVKESSVTIAGTVINSGETDGEMLDSSVERIVSS